MQTAEQERAWWDAHTDRQFIWPDSDWDESADLCLAKIAPILPDAGWVLDLGCGPGRVAIRVGQAHPNLRVLGVDISEAMLTVARQADPRRDPAAWRECDGRSVPTCGSWFAAAWSIALFQHLPHDGVQRYLGEIARVLIPGGRFCFQLVNGDHEPGFLSYAHMRYIERCIDNAALEVEAIDMGMGELGRLFPSWVWVTVRKP